MGKLKRVVEDLRAQLDSSNAMLLQAKASWLGSLNKTPK